MWSAVAGAADKAYAMAMSNASSNSQGQADRATIFALSSGAGRAGVAVIRVSGPNARTALEQMAAPLPAAREVAFRRIRHPRTDVVLDRGVVFWFAGPRSETGEDVAEFQVHGGRAVVRAILDALAYIPNCRLAEAGEFARRAFENGKLDLVQAEGLADLVDAETEAQRRVALIQSGGQLSQIYDGWRTRLIECAALTEAAIDFSDEGDVAADAMVQARDRAGLLAVEMAAHLADQRRGEILRDGFRVVLAGPPNVGKSSLLNALAQRDAAIVSAFAGTTRDVITVDLDLAGLRVIVSDTAGLRDTAEPIEQEGIRRTQAEARRADLILWLTEAGLQLSTMPSDLADIEVEVVTIATKADLLPVDMSSSHPSAQVFVSAATGQGLSDLTTLILEKAQQRIGADESPALTRVRHRQHLEQSAAALHDFLTGGLDAAELRAEDVRRAAFALGRLTGRVDVEDVLDQVFGRFCIGK